VTITVVRTEPPASKHPSFSTGAYRREQAVFFFDNLEPGIPSSVHGVSPGGSPMSLLDYTGYAAALCTTGAYVPQVLRVWRTRSTQDISLKMFLVLVTGLVLWLVYGFWKGEIPLIAANGVTLMLAGIILYFKIKHG
jgi:MtN3 and saliva related transmembrane protein